MINYNHRTQYTCYMTANVENNKITT